MVSHYLEHQIVTQKTNIWIIDAEYFSEIQMMRTTGKEFFALIRNRILSFEKKYKLRAILKWENRFINLSRDTFQEKPTDLVIIEGIGGKLSNNVDKGVWRPLTPPHAPPQHKHKQRPY